MIFSKLLDGPLFGPLWVTCPPCFALWPVPHVKMILILTAGSSPQKGRFAFPALGLLWQEQGGGN